MMNQNLSQRLLQKLSPQQIQLMKLFLVPTFQLEERIQAELEINPALEEGVPTPEDLETDKDTKGNVEVENIEQVDDNTVEAEIDAVQEVTEENSWEEGLDDLSMYYEDDDVADYKLKDTNYPDPNEEDRMVPIPVQTSFYEYLENQLQELDLDEKQKGIAEQIIGSIDEDGYLRRELDAVADDLAFQQNIIATTEEIEVVLEKIQMFEPAGVGARNLKECLLLQLNKKKPNEPGVPLAFKIVDEQFEAFIKKHFDKIQKELELSNEDLKEAIEIVTNLNPKPGIGYSGNLEKQQYIIPDYLVVNNAGTLELTLNSRNAPDLRVSRDFKDMLRDYDKNKNKTKQQKEAVLFIKQKIDSAKWFIDAIQQRQHTLMITMNAILKYQYEYFLTGDETKLKPMILRDISEITQQDVSTVSRVSSTKYVQTEFGTFPLKYFFSEAIQTDSGEEASSREVKQIVQDLIAAEDKSKPLSDIELTEALNNKGYNIARRTVAKYREMLDFPVARLRKEL